MILTHGIEIQGDIVGTARALVRRPSAEISRGASIENTGSRIDFEQALTQHHGYVECLKKQGLNVIELPPLNGYPDACFVEDTAIVIGRRVLMTRPGALTRQGEVASVEKALSPFLEVTWVQAPGTIDGGDVMRVGERIYVGHSNRTNSAGRARLSAFAAVDGIEVIGVPVIDALHLKSVACPIADDRIVLLEGAMDPEVFVDAEAIVVPSGEAAAANIVALGRTLLMPTRCPQTKRQLRALNYEVIEVDTSQFAYVDGALTCLSVLF